MENKQKCTVKFRYPLIQPDMDASYTYTCKLESENGFDEIQIECSNPFDSFSYKAKSRYSGNSVFFPGKIFQEEIEKYALEKKDIILAGSDTRFQLTRKLLNTLSLTNEKKLEYYDEDCCLTFKIDLSTHVIRTEVEELKFVYEKPKYDLDVITYIMNLLYEVNNILDNIKNEKLDKELMKNLDRLFKRQVMEVKLRSNGNEF
jgi:hypothetical protein